MREKNRHKLIMSDLIGHNNLFLYKRLTERGKKKKGGKSLTEEKAVM